MFGLNTIEEALQDLQLGKPVIVVDDENRENEGDLVLAAQFATPEAINLMVREARGLVCISLTQERLKTLGLQQMVPLQENDSQHTTPFTVSVDAKSGITTGISAADRARTIEVLIDEQTNINDLVRPGHMFPLAADKNGVVGRAGHTEAGVDLMQLAHLYPAAVICEIMNENGTMARLPQLRIFAQKHHLKIISIEELVRFKLAEDKTVLFQARARAFLPTEFGTFEVTAYQDRKGLEHLMLKYGNPNENALVRIHSECLTGDVFGSLRCDCGEQLRLAQKRIAESGSGIIIYLRQEGRGIGLTNKMKAYALQEQGLDTVEANLHLGFESDQRDYELAVQILKENGIKSVRLMTNNPQKVNSLQENGIEVIERIPHQVKAKSENRNYLQVKMHKMQHLLDTSLV